MPAETSDQPLAIRPSDDREAVQDEPAQPEARGPSLHSKESMEHQIEEALPIALTSLDPTVSDEIKTSDLVTPDPFTPDLATPDQSKPSTFWSSSFGVSVCKGGGYHKDHRRPEPKPKEVQPTKGVNGQTAATRDTRTPRCKHGNKRELDQVGDDVENKICKFHKGKKGEDKLTEPCQ